MNVDTASIPSATPLVKTHARPTKYRSGLRWVLAGVRRQTPAITGALVAAWTGLPLALWGMVLLGLFGAFAGLIGTSELELRSLLGVEFGFGIELGVGAASGVLGAIAGALAGLTFIYFYLVAHPLLLLGTLVTGVVIATVVLICMIQAEPFLMELRGYREPSRREKQLLHPLLIDVGRRMGLSTVPALWISDQQKPGAWTHMRGIVLTRGLLGEYSAAETPPVPDLDTTALAAILAHELHHWDSGDVVGSTIVFACFYPIAMIVNVVAWVRQRADWLGVILWFFLWPFWLSTKLVVVPLMTQRTRRYEYEADACTAMLGDDYRVGLRRALDELSVWERPRTGWEDVLAATHPPIEIRLQMLEA